MALPYVAVVCLVAYASGDLRLLKGGFAHASGPPYLLHFRPNLVLPHLA